MTKNVTARIVVAWLTWRLVIWGLLHLLAGTMATFMIWMDPLLALCRAAISRSVCVCVCVLTAQWYENNNISYNIVSGYREETYLSKWTIKWKNCLIWTWVSNTCCHHGNQVGLSSWTAVELNHRQCTCTYRQFRSNNLINLTNRGMTLLIISLTAECDGSCDCQISVLSVHVVSSTAGVVTKPDAHVFDLLRRSVRHLEQEERRKRKKFKIQKFNRHRHGLQYTWAYFGGHVKLKQKCKCTL